MANNFNAQTAAEQMKKQNTGAAQDTLKAAVGMGDGTAGRMAGSAAQQNIKSNPAASGGGVMTRQQVPTMDGLLGARSMANNAGIQNVGWDSQNGVVTFDGKGYVKPAKVSDDGTAYADRQTMQSAINQYYRDSGNPLVGARSYVDSMGLSNAATWSDGQLMIGGQQVPVAYVDDNGTAWAKQTDVDSAVAKYKQNSGITGNQGVYDNWKNEYGDRINEALNTILNREKWSYDTENDPAYQAYRDAYTREGNRAYQNAYAQMAANTGGYGSSAGMTAAGQQMNYYMQQLNDRVPELMQNSYNRYMGEQELNRAALNSLLGVADNDYSKAYQANRDSINDSNTANYYSYLRDTAARDYNRQKEVEDRQWRYQEPILQNQVKQSNYDTERYAQNADLDLQTKQINNQMAAMQSVLSKYQYSGNIDMPISAEDAAIAGIPRKEDGTYPTIREIQKAYANLQYDVFENYDLRTLAAELAMKQQY